MQPNSFVLQDLKTLRRIGTARQHQGLLLFYFPKSSFHYTSIQSCNVVTYETWHHKLSHIPIHVYKLICNKVPISYIDSKFYYEVCHIAKQNRFTFTNQNNFSAELFDLIHTNIWGPFREVTFDGFKYFLTLVDDKSRFTWIYLLRNKSDCLFIVPQIFSYVENQFQTTIKRTYLSDFFSHKGVLHQFSCMERPQQNSVVERKHLHILNLARALLFQSYLPLKFWGECVKTAVFLMNRTPSPILKAKSPFEILFAKLPNYADFRTFGTLCYASILISSRLQDLGSML